MHLSRVIDIALSLSRGHQWLMPQAFLVEVLLRGGCAGICLLIALNLTWRKDANVVSLLGTIFSVCTAHYAILSSPLISKSLGSVSTYFAFFATLNSIAFWWFVTALFDDDFRWKLWRVYPALFLISLYLVRQISPGAIHQFAGDQLHQILIITMMLHALVSAVINWRGDLIEPRRHFRIALAIAVGTTGLVIAILEITGLVRQPPYWLTLFHSVALFGLSLAFALWVTRVPGLFLLPASKGSQSKLTEVQDTYILERLELIMANGAFKEPGLTISRLAERIAYPEYKLRKLINGALGFKNFSAYLHDFRLAEAKKELSNPDLASRQITQISFDLGFGSLATFNRVFKATEGITPSEYRRRALNKA